MRVEDLRFEGVLGKGAMATVYAVQHEPTGLSAALKVARTIDPVARRAFLSEARALATLDHTRVVSVWDLGTMQNHPEIPDGSPYLLMERGLGGLQADRFTRWSHIRSALTDVLRGLAHIHGQGFVHRDIKPENLLRFADGYKVGDLGIVVDTLGPSTDGIAGTPTSMAPEQIRGLARDLGPYTDLYGLGATAWRIVTGTWPFFDLRSVPTAALTEALPQFSPRLPVPDGFRDWIQVLLRRDPSSRYQSAAHALQDLHALDQNDRGTIAPQSPREPSPPTLDLATLQLVHPIAPGEQSPSREWFLDPEPPRPTRSVLPYRTPELSRLRPLPLVGRSEECARLWAIAKEVIDEGSLRVVVLRGPHGSGRSRLAQWLGRRLHEATGCGFVPVTDAGNALGPTIEEAFTAAYRLNGLDPAEQEERLVRIFREGPLAAPADQMELFRLLGFRDGGPPMEEAARMRLISLALADAGRTMILLDDVRSGCPTLADASALLAMEPSTPALVVITVDEHESLLELAPHPAVHEIRLGDLPDGAFSNLAALMGADSYDAQRLELFDSRTPAMARALFAPVDEPTDLSESDAASLGIASILGNRFSVATWTRAAGRVGIPPDGLDAAITRGVLRRSGPDSLTFDSPLFQAAVVPSGATAVAMHAACRDSIDPADHPVAHALHAIEAQTPALAIDSLQEALTRAKTAGVRPRVRALTNLLLEALEQSGGDPNEIARHYVQVARQSAWAVPPDELDDLLERTLKACRSCGPEIRLDAYLHSTVHGAETVRAAQCRAWAAADPELASELLTRASVMELLAGNVQEAEATLDGIDPDALLPGAREHYWRSRAELHWQRGRLDEAAEACLRAIEVSIDPEWCPSATSLGYVRLEQGRLEEAEELFQKTIKGTLRNGLPTTATDAICGLGKVHERRGEYERAADLWVEVARMLLVRGSVFAASSIADLSLLYARIGRLEQARLAARQTAQVALAHDNIVWEFVASVVLLASLEDPAVWPEALERADTLSQQTDFHDPDLLRALHLGRSRCPPTLWPQIDHLIDRLTVAD